jgi:hypothetical protein
MAYSLRKQLWIDRWDALERPWFELNANQLAIFLTAAFDNTARSGHSEAVALPTLVWSMTSRGALALVQVHDRSSKPRAARLCLGHSRSARPAPDLHSDLRSPPAREIPVSRAAVRVVSAGRGSCRFLGKVFIVA